MRRARVGCRICPSPRSCPQGAPEARPSPILRRLSRTSESRSGPLSALLRVAPEGATAPRWGRVQRCGEAWPHGATLCLAAGHSGGCRAARGARAEPRARGAAKAPAQKCRLFFLSVEVIEGPRSWRRPPQLPLCQAQAPQYRRGGALKDPAVMPSGHKWSPRSSPPPCARPCGSARRMTTRAPGRTIHPVSPRHL